MKTTQEIYEAYRIMPSLQLHQLRVAAVAKLLCQSFESNVDEHSVVLACLFHDMGNIIKSDLRYFPQFVEPEGFEYWNGVKQQFIAKYGAEHHEANIAIAKEIGLPAASVAVMNGVGFSQLKDVLQSESLERQIAQYADIRVGPHGILSLHERLEEGRKRYNSTRTERSYYESEGDFEKLAEIAEELEKKLFSGISIAPEDLHDEAVAPLIDELRKYAVA